MKTRTFHYLISLVVIACAILAAIQISANGRPDNRPIRLSLAAEKNDYVLGELIRLRFEIGNTSGSPVEIAGPHVAYGNIKLYISNDGQNYVEYAGPNWGSVNGKRQLRKLEAGEAFETKATVLFNRRIATDHLTPMYAERIRKERLDREFALLEPGRYWLKAAYANGRDIYRSEPVEIEITQPVGDDAVVWEEIKTDGAFAYFLQTGQVKYLAGSEETREFTEKVQRIAGEYQGAELSQGLVRNLEKYQRNIEYVQRLKAERESLR